jgi:multicomponent Na+:H+ antiporter subunit F
MLPDIVNATIQISLLLHIVMIIVAVWRIWRGENVIDRLIGVDLTGTLFLAVLVLLALVSENNIFIDIAIAFAALGFISTIALAKYVAEEQIF